MKTITAYQTSDNGIHKDKLTALHREYRIEVRGFIQSKINAPNLSATDIANILATNSKEFIKIASKYNGLITRATPKVVSAAAKPQTK